MRKQESQKVLLEAMARTAVGKSAASSLRREDRLPGVVYGEGKPSVSIQLSLKDLSQALKTKAGENVLITLKLQQDSKKLPETAVLIKELQHHPVTHRIIHVDFHRVSLTKRITVTVPLSFQAEAVGVKRDGGILEHLMWEIQVECLPTQIPAQILVDIASLELGKSLKAASIPMPEGVLLKTDPELPVIACVTPKMEEVPASGAGVAAEPTEPEVLKQKKPEEIAAEEEAKAVAKEKVAQESKAKAG